MNKDTRNPLCESLLEACHGVYGDDLVAVAIYGSWARNVATPESDIDVLIVCSTLPDGRGNRMKQFEAVDQATEATRTSLWSVELPAPELSPVIKTIEEVHAGSPLFLDMTDWCMVLFDHNGFFAGYLEGLRERMKTNGAERRSAKGGYYWVYRPGLTAKEVAEL